MLKSNFAAIQEKRNNNEYYLSQSMIKPTIRLVRPAKTPISLRIHAVWSESFADRMCILQPPGYPKKDIPEPLPYWVDIQADLSLCWSHRSYCRFCHVLAHCEIVHNTVNIGMPELLTILVLKFVQVHFTTADVPKTVRWSTNSVDLDQVSPFTAASDLCLYFLRSDLSGSVGCPSDWWSGGCGFNPSRVRQHSTMEIDYEVFLRSFSTFRWCKKGSSQFSGKRMCTSSRNL